MGGTHVNASDYQMSVQRKTAEGNKTEKVQHGQDISAKETVYYQATVTYRSLSKPANEVEARYIVFVERQQLGQKVGTEQTERIRGTAKVSALKPQEKTTFDTSEIVLNETQLSGKFSGFQGGGRTRAKDSLKGIWIKLFDGDQEVGEYINPSTLKNKIKWE